MMKYGWASVALPESHKVKAQVVGERFEYIKRTEGKLTSKAVLTDARHKNSPLHDAFEWDDAVAAEHYRMTRASQLLMSLVVLEDDKGKKMKGGKVRAFEYLTESVKEPQFERIDAVMADPVKRAEVIQQALKELQRLRAKYEGLKELAAVWKALDRIAS